MSRVEDLIERVKAGDERAVRELKEFAESDSSVVEALVAELKKGRPASRDSRCSALDAFDDELRNLVEEVNANPRDALPMVRAALARAAEVACYRAQLLASEAQCHRVSGNTQRAEVAMEAAWDLGRGCPSSEADLLRRQALLRASQGRYSDALRDLREAFARYRHLGHAGHDHYGNGTATCFFSRGRIRFEMGEYEASARDMGECLSLLSPSCAPKLFTFATVNLAAALHRSGNGLEEAYDLLKKPRRSFSGVRTGSLPRAKLDWLEGILRIELKIGKRKRAFFLLHRALEYFELHGMAAEGTAVAADLALIETENRAAIEALVDRLKPWIRSPKITQRLEALESAARAAGWNARAETLQAARALRGAVAEAPGVLACVLSTPPR